MPLAYLRATSEGRHELAPGLPNMLGLIAQLLPDPALNQPPAAVSAAGKLDRLCALASRPGFALDWRVVGGGKDLADALPSLEFTIEGRPAFLLRFLPGHFVLDLLPGFNTEDPVDRAPLEPREPWLDLWVHAVQAGPFDGAGLARPWEIFGRKLSDPDALPNIVEILAASPNPAALHPTFRLLMARTLIPDIQLHRDVLTALLQHRERLLGPGWLPLPQLAAMPVPFKLDLIMNTVFMVGPGRDAFLRACLEHRVRLSDRGEGGKTLLHLAVDEGNHPEFLRWILTLGMDLEARDDLGRTPLHYAAWKRNPTAFQVLVEGGARTSAVDHDGATPAGMVRETPELHGLLPLLAAPRQDRPAWA